MGSLSRGGVIGLSTNCYSQVGPLEEVSVWLCPQIVFDYAGPSGD
jgi:hypothetical protein